MASKTKPADVKAEKKVETVKFPKEQLLLSNRYKNRKDILGVLLEDGKEYSFEQVNALLDEFTKGKVK